MDNILEKLIIELDNHKTLIIVVMIHKKQEKNLLNKISCKKGLPFYGYIYDSHSDSYCIECYDYIMLGEIPVSFKMTMEGVGNWKSWVPMPETVVRKYFTREQKEKLRHFKASYRNNDFKCHFVQILDCD